MLPCLPAMRIELRPGDHDGFERRSWARSTPQWRTPRAQIMLTLTDRVSSTESAERVAVLMPTVRRRSDLPRLENWPTHVHRPERASARRSRSDRALVAGRTGRHRAAGRGAPCRHRTGDPTNVSRTDSRVVLDDHHVPSGPTTEAVAGDAFRDHFHVAPTSVAAPNLVELRREFDMHRYPRRLGDFGRGPASLHRRTLKRVCPS